MGWRLLSSPTSSRLEACNCRPYLLKSLMVLSVSSCYYRELIILRKFNTLMELHTGSCFWRMSRKEMSAYYLEHASVHHLQKHFDFFEEEARSLLALGLAIPAYDQLLQTSHAFNILDSRGFVGVTERARYFGRIRSLARQCAQLWLNTRESLGHPLGVASDPVHVVCPKELLDTAVKKVNDDSRLFVLEIGTEEMPPQDVVDAGQQLKDLILRVLEKQRLSHGEVQAFGTPRRLLICVENLCTKQTEKEVEV
ncbi:hypothetical protein ACJW31_11G125000 [Castanea mollissima]